MNNPQPSASRKTMSNALHTILGAGGVIGRELMRELAAYTDRIRLVRRHPQPPSAVGIEAFAADLRNPGQVADAVRGSAVAYLVAGLPYRTAVWQAEWPLIMGNVIAACRQHSVRLVFFDNVYLYGRVDGPMTEETPVNPCSAKGEVRARIAQMLMAEIGAGNIHGVIARAADFYGPDATNTFVHPMVFEMLRDGKKAVWLCNGDLPHSLIFTPDAARATALLGNTEDAWGQVWHLPVHPEPPTGRQFITMVATAFHTGPRYRVLGTGLLKLVSLINANVRESMELLYQNQHPYLVDSTKFQRRFFTATSYQEGVEKTVRCLLR
jgi:nucleoside-diphosphate-sugar epimerase